MGGGETDAPLTANGYLLGQLPDENLRRNEKPVYAVRECSDEQHVGLFGHRVSGNQPEHRPSVETLGDRRHRLAAHAGRHRQRAGQFHQGEPATRHRQPLQHGCRSRLGRYREHW